MNTLVLVLLGVAFGATVMAMLGSDSLQDVHPDTERIDTLASHGDNLLFNENYGWAVMVGDNKPIFAPTPREALDKAYGAPRHG